MQADGTGGTGLAETMYSLALFQLRHHTKDTLQRVLLDLHETASACDARLERRLVTALSGRIRHSTAIADALFGITQPQGPFADRFRAICESTAALLASDAQKLDIGVRIECDCPPPLQTPLLRVSKELVANAVKHGLASRDSGLVTVRLHQTRDGIELIVRDDGAGPPRRPASGDGLAIVREFADLLDGTFTLGRERGHTVARLVVRLPRHD